MNKKILFTEFMDISLYHPDHGYYTKKPNIFGDKGDFITSPITSHMFGECISHEFINILKTQEKSSILELGGGDGSLAISIFNFLSETGTKIPKSPATIIFKIIDIPINIERLVSLNQN